jgi:hypothetical protein
MGVCLEQLHPSWGMLMVTRDLRSSNIWRTQESICLWQHNRWQLQHKTRARLYIGPVDTRKIYWFTSRNSFDIWKNFFCKNGRQCDRAILKSDGQVFESPCSTTCHKRVPSRLSSGRLGFCMRLRQVINWCACIQSIKVHEKNPESQGTVCL